MALKSDYPDVVIPDDISCAELLLRRADNFRDKIAVVSIIVYGGHHYLPNGRG